MAPHVLRIVAIAALLMAGAPAHAAAGAGLAVPAGLVWNDIAADHVGLAWSPAAPGQPVAGYAVFRDGQKIATVAGPAYVDRSVTPATAYLYAVAAIDDRGNVSPPSAAIRVTALAGDWATIAGAGDIATGHQGDEATALLLDGVVASDPAAIVVTLGDNAYPDQVNDPYQRYYEPSWGRHRQRTRPVAGNHDYEADGGRAHFAYFGAAAGPPGKGYYSYDLGDWHIVALNSNVGMEAGSEQEKWLRADLAAHATDCILAYLHEPLFSSGKVHGGNPQARPLWLALRDFGADVVLSGNEHNYERFEPQTPFGLPDQGFGMRSFVAGTGGIGNYEFAGTADNSAMRDAVNLGIIRLTLKPGRYDWAFVSTSGSNVDEGSGTCSKGRPGESLVAVSIATGEDDVLEARDSGEIYPTSTGAYMSRYRDGSEQLLGLRFAGLGIPPGSHIRNAFIQFRARDASAGAVTLTLSGEAAGHSADFVAVPGDLSRRARTQASVDWTPEAWAEAEMSSRQRTPSLAAILQEIVDQPGWRSGNAMSVIVSGSGPGTRVGRSYEYSRKDPPMLVIEYGPRKYGALP